MGAVQKSQTTSVGTDSSRKEASGVCSGVAFAVTGRGLLYRQQIPRPQPHCLSPDGLGQWTDQGC